MFDKPDAQRLDYAAYNHADPLDGQQYEPDLPKDEPQDFCLDQLCAARLQMVAHIEQLMRGAAPAPAVVAYLQGVVSECVKEGIGEWMKQENDPSTFRGDEAVIALLELVTNTMVGDGGQVVMSSRKVKLHAWAILYLLQKTEKTQTELARMLGYTKANFCAVVQQYKHKDTLSQDLRKTRGMKSDAAVEVYRERAKQVHKQRKEKEQQCKAQNSNSNNHLLTLRSALMQTLVRES
jgi:hypothetical protein